MKEIIKEKMKSWPMWAAILSLIFFITKEWVGIEIPEWDMFVNILLNLLIAFGIVNNPNSRDTL